MLAPETRLMLTDGLQPPEGYRVDVAVGTTYTLDLNALLMAPLSFALFDHAGTDPSAVDPIRLLEAVRRYGDRTTVFAQAGNIGVPAFSHVLAFIEESVTEVVAPAGVFHPKVWALRFSDGADEPHHLHRLLVLSRNLTFARTWDTIVRLDETETESTIDNAPMVEWLRRLPQTATRRLTEGRRAMVEDLCHSLAGARFAVPEPFTSLEFLPRGMGEAGYPFPERADRALALSAFLDQSALRELPVTSEPTVLVSRAESLDRIGSRALAGFATRTLQRAAEADPDDDAVPESVASEADAFETDRPLEGLHAKTFVFDHGQEAVVISGSGNLTANGWNRNVEFGVRLRGPVRTCGVAAALDGPPEAPGLDRLLEDYEAKTEAGEVPANEDNLLRLEQAHAELAAAGPTLQATGLAEDRVGVILNMQRPWTGPEDTSVALLAVPAPQAWRGTGQIATWEISPVNLTPFLVVESALGKGESRATRRCVIRAELVGDLDERRRDVLAALLRSKQDVLRYLILLLGDPAYDAWTAALAEGSGEGFHPDAKPGTYLDYALFEPLVRAAGRDEYALARVASLMADLGQLDQDLIPDGFEDLWDAVWAAHRVEEGESA